MTTVGIIYHGNCNYDFHPFCTSFAGDSGSGKSTVADLLQLIFVGPGVYESATKSQEPRPLDGLVLGDGTRSGGVAYALVNVAVAAGQFLALGCYLTASTREFYPFIVHRGFAEEGQEKKLFQPFETPVGYQHFLTGGQILPYRDQQRYLEDKYQLGITFYTKNTTAYHRALFENRLLPLDITMPTSLTTYAKIIRSFARSGELEDASKVDYYEFLFGREAAQQLLARYHRLVHEMEATAADQESNRFTIQKTEELLNHFQELIRRRDNAAAAQDDHLQASLRYAQWEEIRYKSEHQKCLRLARQHRATGLCYRAALARLHQEMAARRVADFERREQYRAIIQEYQKKIKILNGRQLPLGKEIGELDRQIGAAEEVFDWLATIAPTLDALSEIQQQDEHTRQHLLTLGKLENILLSEKLITCFTNFTWTWGITPSAATAWVEALRRQREAAEQPGWFSDLDGIDSLAGWALGRGQALTVEEESVLAHFRTRTALAVGAEEAGVLYLAHPEKLLSNMRYHSGQSDAGFWLDFQTVHTWIARLPEGMRAFSEDADPDRIRAHFAQYQAASATGLAQATRQHKQAEALLAAVTDCSAWSALANYEKLVAHRAAADRELLPPEEEFRRKVVAFEQHDLIQQRLAAAQQEWSQIQQTLSDLEKQFGSAQKSINDIGDFLGNATQADLYNRERSAAQAVQLAQSEANAVLADLLAQNPSEYTEVMGATGGGSAEFSERVELELKAESAERGHAMAAAAAETAAAQAARAVGTCQQLAGDYAVRWPNQALPLTAENDASDLEPPSDEACRAAFGEYKTRFDSLVEYHCGIGAGVRFEPEELPLFMRRVVPDYVSELLTSEQAIVEELKNHLRQIVANNEELAYARLTKLNDLLEELGNVVDANTLELKKLSSYLRTGDTQITGKFRAALDVKTYDAIAWVRHFRQTIHNRVAGSEFEDLHAHEALDELMNLTYRRYEKRPERLTGARTPVTTLLDPRTYLTVSFRMESISGAQITRGNRGSTGQTFMAAALLNVARLSLIGQGRARPGIRFMAVDEAHGLGSNYTTLVREARRLGYQIVTLSVEPVVDVADADQNLYFLRLDPEADVPLNLPPLRLRSGLVAEFDDTATYHGPLFDGADNV